MWSADFPFQFRILTVVQVFRPIPVWDYVALPDTLILCDSSL